MQPFTSPTAPPSAQVPPGSRRRSTAKVVALVLAVWVALVGGGAAVAGVAVTLPGLIAQVEQPQTSSPVDGTQRQPDTGSGQVGGNDSGTGSSSGSGSDTGTQTKLEVDAPSEGVVFIEATTSEGAAAGTGMVLTSDGYVLTNYHVVAGSSAVQVTIADTGTTYTAAVVGDDSTRDVALLKLSGASGLQTVTIDDDAVGVGDTVVALGNANGEKALVPAAGSVTGLDQSLQVSSESPWGTTENLSGMIETNAGAVPGDSGGPMYDDEGEVIGITTAGSTSEGVSYAVPIATAMKIVNQITSGDESGTVRIGPAGYLGISTNNTTSSRSGGLVISSVATDGPAAAAGIAAGDVLVSFNGTQITSTTNAAEIIRETEPGQKVKVSWIDSSTGTTKTATVTMGSSPLA
ncbi:S1C family serine protease [Propionicicella superfundia]|uniref:S1C family serine protease n=1 Tax=Propionicicella superfundia TaxID=348582 RepID=UPI000403185B|nr:trypsin-like peptidase domain-containing protein [Propionicicella superfundia]